jgi:hypothetical protein
VLRDIVCNLHGFGLKIDDVVMSYFVEICLDFALQLFEFENSECSLSKINRG